METDGRYDGLFAYIRFRQADFLIGYGGGALLLTFIIIVSGRQGWYSFISLSMAALLIMGYFFTASLWAAQRLYGNNKLRDLLLDLGGIESGDDFVHINLVSRRLPISLSHRIISGQITVIDVYNPQLAPARALARAHPQLRQPPDDPRLEWLDGRIDLLPLPDASVKVVTISQALSEFWQQGDQKCLLREIYRILAPGGRLIVAERVRTPTNLLVMGPAWLRLQPPEYWRQLLASAHLQPRRISDLHGLICCFRADKPMPGEAKQLIFDF